jgi:hypothetical protein
MVCSITYAIMVCSITYVQLKYSTMIFQKTVCIDLSSQLENQIRKFLSRLYQLLPIHKPLLIVDDQGHFKSYIQTAKFRTAADSLLQKN